MVLYCTCFVLEIGEIPRVSRPTGEAATAQASDGLRPVRFRRLAPPRLASNLLFAMTAYNSWDREAAVRRALAHADSSSSSEADGGMIWNFAFGSNISAAKVKSRGMIPSASLRGRLPGWTLLFNHNGGYGNIETVEKIQAAKYDLSCLPQPVPEETHGVLLRLSRRDFAELARQEYAYDTVEVAVEVYDEDCSAAGVGGDGETKRIQHALAFKTSACALTTARTMPTARYISIIREGAKKAGISAQYCRWLEAIRPNY